MEKDFAYLNLFGSGGAALLNPFRIHKGMHGTLVNVTPDAATRTRNQYKHSHRGADRALRRRAAQGRASRWATPRRSCR